MRKAKIEEQSAKIERRRAKWDDFFDLRSSIFGLFLGCLAAATVAMTGCVPSIQDPPDSDQVTAITRGMMKFASPMMTTGGLSYACANCHAADGSGDVGPDIRASDVSHLTEHAQEDGPHPEGVKFTTLAAADFDDIAAYLASICEADADCEAGSMGGGDHGHDEE